MKSLSTLALITAFTSTAAFAAGTTCDQPSFPGFGQGFNPTQPMAANYEPGYIKAMREEMVKRGTDMRAEIDKQRMKLISINTELNYKQGILKLTKKFVGIVFRYPDLLGCEGSIRSSQGD